MPPPVLISITVPVRSANGAAGGNGSSTTSTVPLACGVAAPQTGVKSEMPCAPGRWLRPLSALSGPEPCHWPSIVTRSMIRLPSSVMPSVERFGCGGASSTPDCISIPLGRPSSNVKRSPLTPATFALDMARFCIDVTVSRPRSVSFESSGRSAYSPPGRGARRMWTTTGPLGVNWSWRS